mgnify:CR=1 FL=1
MVEKLEEKLQAIWEILDIMDVEIGNSQRAALPVDWEHVVEDDVIDQLHTAKEMIQALQCTENLLTLLYGDKSC